MLIGVDSGERQGDCGCFRMAKPAKGTLLIGLRQQDAWSEAEKQGLRAAMLYKTRGTESISSLSFSHHPCSILTKGETHMCDCHVYHWCNLLFGAFYSVSSLMARGSKPLSAQEAAQLLLSTWQLYSLLSTSLVQMPYSNLLGCASRPWGGTTLAFASLPCGHTSLKSILGRCVPRSQEDAVSLCPLTLTLPHCTQNLKVFPRESNKTKLKWAKWRHCEEPQCTHQGKLPKLQLCLMAVSDLVLPYF